MNFNLPEEDGRPQIYQIDPVRVPRIVVPPEIFRGRTEPILIEFTQPPPPPPCPCCAARKRLWRKVCIGVGAFIAILAIGLLCHFAAPRAFEYSKTAFASAPEARTTQAVAPQPTTTIINDFFVFDAVVLTQSMTPARLTESQGEALFQVLSNEEDDELVAPPPVLREKGCEDGGRCTLLDLVKHFEAYYPAFITSYLDRLGDPQDDHEDDKNDEPIDYFDWVISFDEAISEGTTPAFLPNGPTTEDSASAFYEMTQGHAPKIRKHESVIESVAESVEPAALDTAWHAGTDSFFAIIQQVIEFGQSTSDSLFDIFQSATTHFLQDCQRNFGTYLVRALVIFLVVLVVYFGSLYYWPELKAFSTDLLPKLRSLARHVKLHFWIYLCATWWVWHFHDYESLYLLARHCQQYLWTYLVLFILIVNLLYYEPELTAFLSSDFIPELRASHLVLNAWLSRVPLVGAQIPSMARGMKETLRQWVVSKIGWLAAETDNGDGLVGGMEEVRAARRRNVAWRIVFGDSSDRDWV